MEADTTNRFALYYEQSGQGPPILLVHPSGSTASTWGPFAGELARVGRVITYDRRGYARSGGEPVHSVATHTADAAALLDHLQTPPAVVVGTSAGAVIAVDLAVRRPDLVHAVVAHEMPWRYTRHRPSTSQVTAILKIGLLALGGRRSAAADVLLRNAYAYRDGGSAWDAFPASWREVGRDNAGATLADFWNSIRSYPSAGDLATIRAPVICTYGERSPENMRRVMQGLAAAIPTASLVRIDGSAHAAPFDAPGKLVEVIASAVSSSAVRP